MYRIFDSHAHIYPNAIAERAVASIGEFYDIELKREGTAEELLREADEAGVNKCLVHSVATLPRHVKSINNFIIESVNAHPNRFIGFGAMHMEFENPYDELKRIKDRGLKGIKLHPDFQRFEISDAGMDEIYEAMEALELPVLFHTGDRRYTFSHPKHIPIILKKHPRLRVVCAHFGGWSVWDEAAESLRGTDVYVDTSSSLKYISREDALRYISIFGYERVLFGSDFPAWNVGEELNRFLSLGLPDKANERILYKNLSQLLNTD